jgi:hypothetical protein
MIYRRSPPHPPRLLLRVVGAAGTGLLLGAAACSGEVNSGLLGQAPDDVADAANNPHALLTDATPAPADEASTTPPDGCLNGFCGFFPRPSDAGFAGSLPMPEDAGHSDDARDAALTCGHGGVCGSVVMPEDAGQSDDASDAAPSCGHGGVCGSVVMPEDAGHSDDAGDAAPTCGHGGVCGITILPDAGHIIVGVVINPGP